MKNLLRAAFDVLVLFAFFYGVFWGFFVVAGR